MTNGPINSAGGMKVYNQLVTPTTVTQIRWVDDFLHVGHLVFIFKI